MSAPQQRPRESWPFILGGLVVVVSVIAAAVVLSLAGRSDGQIAALIATVTSALGILLPLLRETRQQTETLAQIQHNTNGVLDQRIQDAVHRALDQHHTPDSSDSGSGQT